MTVHEDHPTLPEQSFRTLRGRRWSFLDFGRPAPYPPADERPVILALHGHFGRGRIFAPLAAALADRYRVIAPDQRAHGLSQSGGELTPGAYVADAAAFLRALELPPVAVLGHSMGGAIGYLLAERHPELVAALVVADMTVRNHAPEVQPVLDVSGWPRRTATREELRADIEARGIPDASYFLHSAHRFEDGWGLLFDPDDMMASQDALTGDFSASWCASGQPALLLRGGGSFILTPETAGWMTRERPNTELVELPGCGHWLHDDAPDAFAEAVGSYLDRVLDGPGSDRFEP
ncbi:alpha/beta fold hydrolase [Streptomyces oceani]|uniref:Alpha/beta hydrolase n=1 Tax=Streptomyces oceani TaxID=1075402 RepID=A0A1E7JWW5_9ACTN|nr:alpha/beta hydrolase [Streptomyces oceani]OEU96123.1 alpha/beta hydrolase [Streptomyces oceani]